MNKPTRPEVTGRRAGLSGGGQPPALPKLFATVAEARLCFGVSKTRLYDHLVPLDPDILVQVGGRTLVDVARLKALIDSMPRGPRKPSAPGRNRKGPKRT
jgi:hypothetical protein